MILLKINHYIIYSRLKIQTIDSQQISCLSYIFFIILHKTKWMKNTTYYHRKIATGIQGPESLFFLTSKNFTENYSGELFTTND